MESVEYIPDDVMVGDVDYRANGPDESTSPKEPIGQATQVDGGVVRDSDERDRENTTEVEPY